MADIKFALLVPCPNCKKEFYALYEKNPEKNVCPFCQKEYKIELAVTLKTWTEQ